VPDIISEWVDEPAAAADGLPRVGDSVVVLPGAIGRARNYVGEAVKIVEVDLSNPHCPILRFEDTKGRGDNCPLVDGEWKLAKQPVAATPTTFKVGDRVRFTEHNPNCGKDFGAEGDYATVEAALEYVGSYYGPQVHVRIERTGKLANGPIEALELATPALPTVGDWVKDQGGRIGIVFHDDGDDYANLKVGMTEDGDVEYYLPRDLTIVPPGTKPDKPVPAPANDNYEVGDIVEIVDTGIFEFSVSVGDIAAVTGTDGHISIRVQTKAGPVDQVVFLENASHIRPYRRTT
jgi:hypothetical protein